MIEVYIHNVSRLKRVNSAFLKKIARKILQSESKKSGIVSIVLLSSQKARKINVRYRKKDYTPQVLSFEGERSEGELGEIVLCPAAIKQEAKAQKTSFEKELTFCLIHGLLHLLGYSHLTEKSAKLMEQKEKGYLKIFHF